MARCNDVVKTLQKLQAEKKKIPWPPAKTPKGEGPVSKGPDNKEPEGPDGKKEPDGKEPEGNAPDGKKGPEGKDGEKEPKMLKNLNEKPKLVTSYTPPESKEFSWEEAQA